MNNWQAYADLSSARPGHVRVTLGAFGRKSAEVIEFGDLSVRRIDVEEGVAVEAHRPLELHVDAAQAVYRALDRIFGNHHEQGEIDAIRAALAKEQARVDHVLTAFLPTIIPSAESLARPPAVPGPGSADS